MWSRKLARTPLAKDVHCAAMKACFRCDASEHIGYGHLMRCLTIADAARPSMASDFAMAHSDHRARDLVLHRGHNVIDLSGAMEFESTNLGPHLINSQVVIFDLSHGLDMSRRANLKCYVNETAKSEVLCILIDGMAPHAAVIESGWNVDILVVPYVGAPEHVEDYDTLSGPHFSVLPLEFGTLNETRQIADKARKILVTFGGCQWLSAAPPWRFPCDSQKSPRPKDSCRCERGLNGGIYMRTFEIGLDANQLIFISFHFWI